MREKYSFVPSQNPPLAVAVIQNLVVQFFTQQKVARTAAAAAASTAQQNALGALGGASAHPVLNAYEKAHLAIGSKTLLELFAELKRFMQQQAGGAGSNLTYRPNGVQGAHDLLARPDQANGQRGVAATIIGTIFEGDNRFAPVNPAVVGVLNPLFHRIGQPQRHYIQLPDGTFLRRFVTRGLNQNDSLNLMINGPLGAPCPNAQATLQDVASPQKPSRHGLPLVVGANMPVNDQVLSHTRGWQKRFISATTTQRPVFSTRGEQFRSLFGAVLIDLAQVPTNAIFDLHRPDRVNTYLGFSAQTIVDTANPEPPHPRTIADERFLAARDIVRTREVLIHFQVPNQAVDSTPGQICVLGICGNDQNTPAFAQIIVRDVSGRAIVNSETPEYKWRDRWWTFLEFGNNADAVHARNVVLARIPDFLGPAPGFGYLLFRQYAMPNPMPAGY